MTLRERIADWISGGMIGATERALQHYITIAGQLGDKAVKLERSNIALSNTIVAKDMRIEGLKSTLTLIADQETDNANATVKRMARMAREGRAGFETAVLLAQAELSFEEVNGHRKGMLA